jgi:hypothetical protein
VLKFLDRADGRPANPSVYRKRSKRNQLPDVENDLNRLDVVGRVDAVSAN